MAEETQNPAPETAPVQNPTPETAPTPEHVAPVEDPNIIDQEKVIQPEPFKDETNVAGELPELQKKALDDLKLLIQDSLKKGQFKTPTPPKEESKRETEEDHPKKNTEEEDSREETEEDPKKETERDSASKEVVETEASKKVEVIEETIISAHPETKSEDPKPEEVSIYGVPILGDERSDVILLKFLRARDFKVKDAFAMIRNTVRWRESFGIEFLLEEDLGVPELDNVVFTHGSDTEGHSVCYNVYGEFQNKELYQATFSDEEKRLKFLRWRIRFLERSIRKLDFSPDGINTIVQVNDLKNSPGPGKWELRQATNQAVNLLQDNYPEFVAKQIFINVPWWYLAVNRMISPFLTQRTKSKFVFAGQSKSADTLFKYISPEQVPIQYGGLSKEGEQEFDVSDAVTEITMKPASKHILQIPVESGGWVVWDVRTVGWDVSYGAEFVPSDDGYTVIIQKTRKVGPTDEAVISDAYRTGDPGNIVITIDNQTSKKKKLLYRHKTKA